MPRWRVDRGRADISFKFPWGRVMESEKVIQRQGESRTLFDGGG